jgi:radical SAM superfamily enzyme YgiQ (UPF0313 family)
MSKKVLLIAPLTEEYSGNRNYGDPPIGVHRLSSFINANGHECEVYDCNIDGPIESYLQKEKWDIIGISILNNTLKPSLNMFLRIEKEHPEAILVAGNSEATMNYSEIFENTNIRIVIIGEGELAILDLCNDVPLHKVRGIIYKNNVTPITDNLLWEYYKNIDFLKMGWRKYWELDKKKIRRKTLRLVTSSHCLRGCHFCSLTQMHSFACGKKIKPAKLSGEQIRILIDRALEQIPELTHIYFVEDSILPTINRIDDFCYGLEKYKDRIKFLVQCETDKVNYEIIKKLASVNVIHISFGLENASENVRISFGKRQNEERINNIINWCNEFNVRCYYLIILFYPSSKIEDLIINYKILSKWIKEGKVTISCEPFTIPYKGALLYNQDYNFGYKYHILNNKKILKQPYIVYPKDHDVNNIMLEFMDRQQEFLKKYINNLGCKHFSKDYTGAANIALLGEILKEKKYI